MIVSLKRYAAHYLVAMAGVFAVIVLLRQITGVNLSSAAVPVLPAMAAAMLAGSRYARASKAPLDPRAAWKAAAAMTGVALGFNLALGAVLVAAAPKLSIAPGALRLLGFYLAVYCLAWLLVNRFFLSLGVRNERSAQARADS